MDNSKGVAIEGIKGSVYTVREHIYPEMHILEEADISDMSNPKLKNFGAVIDSNTKVFNHADSLIQEGLKPILFGGDHAIAIGSISASSKHYQDLTVIWIDAHADIHGEVSSPSGNIHGMPLRFLLGEGDKKLTELGGFSPKIKPENIVHLGLRSVEPEEADYIKQHNIKSFYYTDIQRLGLDAVLQETMEHLRGKQTHVSLDFDSIDPTIFPAVTTPVESGFTLEELHRVFDTIFGNLDVVSFDFTEYNATKDPDGKSFEIVREFVQKINGLMK